jgi:hypothetical protein
MKYDANWLQQDLSVEPNRPAVKVFKITPISLFNVAALVGLINGRIEMRR